MIRSLRRRHRKIWLIFTPILFSLITLALILRMTPSTDETISAEVLEYGKILNEYENEFLKINVRGEATAPELIELILKKPLKAASAQVLLKADNRLRPLGQIESTGTYHFRLENNIIRLEQIQLFDYIKKVEISTIDI